MSLTIANAQAKLYFGELSTYLKGKMDWICEASDYVLTMSVSEPMNKPVFCTGCGKTHVMKPGELSPSDRAAIERLKEIAASGRDIDYDFDDEPEEINFSDLNPRDLAYLQSA